ncbi:helix-turn-helix domain-containing protein [Candidatus Gottesmanbacteria bacterium]|nr:helix-turn-helix domain-containing protein [Candidatus Gottesmanbacteria bacterium]
MARITERRKAIQLRRRGYTYSEIRRKLLLPKSTLSDWLRGFILTDSQLNNLRKHIKRNKYVAMEKTRRVKYEKRQNRLLEIYKNEKRKWLPLSEKELFLAGLFLYWGEGNKAKRHTVSINNTDPLVVKFALYWILKSLKVPKNKVRVFLHLYSDMNIKKELTFWKKQLSVKKNQFTKPYIKKTKKSDLDQKGFGHGTCGIQVNSTFLKEKILMSIKAIADYYDEKLTKI